MEKMVLGKTGLTVSRTGLGCIPIQRIPYESSTEILKHAYRSGITFYDTANAYTTSEDRIGTALGDVRQHIVIATKSAPLEKNAIMKNIENSLSKLRTDYIDIFQVHNPAFLPVPGGDDGIYDTLLEAKKAGKIRHIGISNHRLKVAKEAAGSGLYDTVQFPLSLLSNDDDLSLIDVCKKHNVGLIAMKGMAGGILSQAKAAFAFLRQYENVVPIWGIQEMEELREFLSYEEHPPVLDSGLWASIEDDRKRLGGAFCRGCNYCAPCPAGISISSAARITYLIQRSVPEQFFTPAWREKMDQVSGCINCGQCKTRCPYFLDPPALLKTQLAEYNRLYNQYK